MSYLTQHEIFHGFQSLSLSLFSNSGRERREELFGNVLGVSHSSNSKNCKVDEDYPSLFRQNFICLYFVVSDVLVIIAGRKGDGKTNTITGLNSLY